MGWHTAVQEGCNKNQRNDESARVEPVAIEAGFAVEKLSLEFIEI